MARMVFVLIHNIAVFLRPANDVQKGLMEKISSKEAFSLLNVFRKCLFYSTLFYLILSLFYFYLFSLFINFYCINLKNFS